MARGLVEHLRRGGFLEHALCLLWSSLLAVCSRNTLHLRDHTQTCCKLAEVRVEVPPEFVDDCCCIMLWKLAHLMLSSNLALARGAVS